jgi:hypothetical protein
MLTAAITSDDDDDDDDDNACLHGAAGYASGI